MTGPRTTGPGGPLRSYGRIKSRGLKPNQERLLQHVAPKLALAPGPIDPARLFTDARAYVLEIGFGSGEHILARARAEQECGFIGVEPFLNGLASCLRGIEEAGLTNVRLHQGDARDVLARLPDAALAHVYVLFPDPWPKTRHWKRRLIQAETLQEIARVLIRGGELRFATDWADYAAWTLALLLKEQKLEWLAQSAPDWRLPWPGHSPTRYQAKQLGDCAPIWLRAGKR